MPTLWSMIALLRLSDADDQARVEKLLARLRLDPAGVALQRGERAKMAAAVQTILADVAQRGDEAIVDSARQFDDPNFTAGQIRVTAQEMAEAATRVPADQLAAIRRSIAQVRQYQTHVMPKPIAPLKRPGVELGIRYTPLDSAGLYFPGGKASYPSSLIMLAVPAQVAGVKQIVVTTPPSRYGRSDLVLATAAELGLEHVYRAGGAAAIGAMAFGTGTIPAVDKIVGPGNSYVQLAKRALAGCVGIDGYLGPSEVLVIADETGRADFIAADMIAQAEHDPGSSFLLTSSPELADQVATQLKAQTAQRQRSEAIEKALTSSSAIIVGSSLDELIDLANRFAAEHVNVQTRDNDAVLAKLKHAGAVFVGPYSPIAAGDYVAGPSHCLPTNTTARFTSGVSVYSFLKTMSVERYDAIGLAADAPHIVSLAQAEGLEAHGHSVKIRANH
ncbi:MAG: histidinol dehydrogenase [Phycisphaerales bacterium]|nr:histidinol dehydrogenase [Phycisphaerales bacterium]